MAEEFNLLAEANIKDAEYEAVRNIFETELNITAKSKADLLRASAQKVISDNIKGKDAQLKAGVKVNAVTKSTAKKLGITDLF